MTRNEAKEYASVVLYLKFLGGILNEIHLAKYGLYAILKALTSVFFL